MELFIIIYFISAVVLLIISAFFSLSETALTSVSQAKLYRLYAGGHKRANRVLLTLNHKEKVLGTVLLGNNATNIIASALATAIAMHFWGEEGIAFASIIMTALVLVFCEVLPKTYALQYAERVSLIVIPIFSCFVALFGPVTTGVEYVVKKLINILNYIFPSADKDKVMSGADELKGVIDFHHQEGSVVTTARDMLKSILDLDQVSVEQVMVHRKHIHSVSIDLPPSQILEEIIGSGYSRVPLYHDNPDNVIAILHLKDVFKKLRLESAFDNASIDKIDIRSITLEPHFVPDTTSLSNQLHSFRKSGSPMALVVDEYGVIKGLITLGDIIEEIIGKIEDSTSSETPLEMLLQEDGSYIAQSTLSVRECNRELHWNLPEEEASTLGGLVLQMRGEIPNVGDKIRIDTIEITVLAKKAHNITKLHLRKMALPDE